MHFTVPLIERERCGLEDNPKFVLPCLWPRGPEYIPAILSVCTSTGIDV